MLEAEIPRSWCQKDSSASGVSQVPFSVFRKWSGAFSKLRGGLETAARTIFRKSGRFSKYFQGSRRIPNVMRDHEVLSSTVRELERLHIGTQIAPKRAMLSSINFLRQSRMDVRDTLCRTVWMQTSQERKGRYAWTESSTFQVLP